MNYGNQQKMKRLNSIKQKNDMELYKLIDRIEKRFFFIMVIVLYDKMGMSFKKLDNCLNRVYELKQQWKDDSDNKITNESILIYCKKKKIPVQESIKKIPNNEKLFLAECKKPTYGAVNIIDSTMLSIYLLMVPVLKETYRYSNDKIEEFFNWIAYAVRMYSTKLPKEPGYVYSDEYIRLCILEDEGFDMATGEYVDKQK